MNLALKDIRHNAVRFLLTVTGVAFLITASIGMVGLYRGIVSDALLIIEEVGADLWVVQGGRAGPFSESSAISAELDRRVEGVAGVASARRFVQVSQQFDHGGRQLRAALVGVDYPEDAGQWTHLIQGRPLASGHFEAIADEAVGLSLGDRIRLGQEDYTIVGLTRGMVDMSGDGLLLVSVNDALAIAQRRTSEEVLLARSAGGRAPAAPSGGSSVRQDSKIAAVLVTLDPAADPEAVRRTILRWGDANVLSKAEQAGLLLDQRLWRLRVQILAFTAVLLLVMTIVISLIIYMLTMEKVHEIALLKLMGARNTLIIGMIAQQSFLIGAAALGLGLVLAQGIFPHFPRKVAIDPGDIAMLGGAVALVCGFASLIGISRAMKVRAQEVLS
ncbi:ABC transporter permease [Aquabacter spiritensis]|uniref:Putative ABC transport system permease protein n=1 Tax=Aquabacter spiritensis TaxID=933073 RepID=A0A4R3LUD7_9HYPH|nr:ABC transporter permease [Aquabacter spiritensis]TCT02017.1 putative ABC transport system permease protein [Aquabacter spiritensis]